MKYYIRNMACDRCKVMVQAELERLGFHPVFLQAGELEISEDLDESRTKKLKEGIRELNLEIITNREGILIDRIKSLITELVYEPADLAHMNVSDYLSSKLGYSYHYLSILFSLAQGASIEKFYIHQKIERVKEILMHEDLSFSEIAYKLNYSSPSHLSGQFRKETGLTLSQYRKLVRESC